MPRLSPHSFNERQWASLKEVPFVLPNLQCHRGYREKGAKENTLEALQTAFELGYQMAETDLRLNRDGKIILFHDPLQDQPELGDAAQLEMILDILPANCYFNLEIKNESKINFSLEEKLIAFLKKHPKKEQILFSSFNPLSLAWMAKLLPEVPRALLVTQANEPGNSFLLRDLSLLSFAKPHFLDVRWEDLDHYKDIPADRKIIWTLNDRDFAKTLLERKKVASIITDSILPTEFKA